jgi:(E)-4-hydroxy-3-methylbut-2-enyl-diphosphate synthase
VYVDGRLHVTLRGEAIVADFLRILDDYVATRYPSAGSPATLAAPGGRDGA